ncbi:hypothetical protein D3227_06060 [Mesorhizobium waimense]|uniref:MFS transporter permease n=1 Tax=Mesorhizobium waimense TaxID=1300307 RepID=A0A3A5KZT0_9HYPH|nr:DUF6064 family protein [Mesorhizobium waimense]RJT41356.1 hypothetical protein D3227_06060 [Mesorhizobium waimense]
MSEWWTYRPEDFLLFSPRVYWRMFELQNEALWSLHLVTVAAGLAIFMFLLRRPNRDSGWIGLLLAALWVFVGWTFLWNRYVAINWAIFYVAPLFAFQAVVLLIAAIMPGGLRLDRRDVAGWTGLLFAAAGLVLYPLFPPLVGRPWTSAEVFGIAPDPTVIVTLGLLLAARGKLLPLLFPIPSLWCLLSGVTLWTMDDRQAWLPLVMVAIVLAALGLRSLIRRSAS